MRTPRAKSTGANPNIISKRRRRREEGEEGRKMRLLLRTLGLRTKAKGNKALHHDEDNEHFIIPITPIIRLPANPTLE